MTLTVLKGTGKVEEFCRMTPSVSLSDGSLLPGWGVAHTTEVRCPSPHILSGAHALVTSLMSDDIAGDVNHDHLV